MGILPTIYQVQEGCAEKMYMVIYCDDIDSWLICHSVAESIQQ